MIAGIPLRKAACGCFSIEKNKGNSYRIVLSKARAKTGNLSVNSMAMSHQDKRKNS